MVYRLSDSQMGRFNQYSFGSTPRVDYSGQYTQYHYPPQMQPQMQPPKQKVGFWEGLKAIGKGLLKPIKELIKHPIKSALMITATAALVIGTGGAATPFLIAAGVGIGGWQIAKGTVGAIMSDNREETLANLEDIGSGSFAVAASAVGAKTYMSATTAGSATATASQQVGFWAKAGVYLKGMGQDVVSVAKMAPSSLKTTLAMIKSGQFMGNLQSAYATGKLAAQHRNVAKAKVEQQQAYQAFKAAEGDSAAYRAWDNYLQAKNAYISKLDAYMAAKAKIAEAAALKQEAIFNKYVEMANAKNSPILQNNATSLIDNGFTRIPSTRYALNYMNPLRNNTTENLGVAINGNIGLAEEQVEEMAPYVEAAMI